MLGGLPPEWLDLTATMSNFCFWLEKSIHIEGLVSPSTNDQNMTAHNLLTVCKLVLTIRDHLLCIQQLRDYNDH